MTAPSAQVAAASTLPKITTGPTTTEPIAPAGFLGGLASRTVELRELRYFHSVARTGNFGRAARELNIGQPNVSQQVHKLEQ